MPIVITFKPTLKEFAVDLFDMLPGGKYYKKYIFDPLDPRSLEYEPWIESVGGKVHDFNYTMRVFSIFFENERDAVIFKLRYM
jgi:hypothetical protein